MVSETKKKELKKEHEELIGKKIGLWTVQRIERKRAKNGALRIEVICKCECGNSRQVQKKNLLNGKTLSCGCLRDEELTKKRKERSPNWRGGRKVLPNGYIEVYCRDDNERRGRYVYEHRKVMEDYLGRKLYPHENVHHLNGVKDDNRLENLELWSRSQPPGQRVVDKLKWAKEIIKIYGQTGSVNSRASSQRQNNLE